MKNKQMVLMDVTCDLNCEFLCDFFIDTKFEPQLVLLPLKYFVS